MYLNNFRFNFFLFNKISNHCIKLISYPSLQVSFLYWFDFWHMLLHVCGSSIYLWSTTSLKISIESTEVEMPEPTREQNVLRT